MSDAATLPPESELQARARAGCRERRRAGPAKAPPIAQARTALARRRDRPAPADPARRRTAPHAPARTGRARTTASSTSRAARSASPTCSARHDTLFTYLWMYGPERERPCPMCTSFVGSLDVPAPDIEQRLSLAIVGRSPVARQLAFARERGWTNLKFYQAIDDDFVRRHRTG